MAAASRQFDLAPAEVESWVEDGKRGMGNVLRATPEGVREQYERQAQGTPGGLRRGDAGDPRRKKLASLLGKDES